MQILAFHGLRYTDHAGEVDDLAAPPFDQIDDDARGRLHRRSPYQFAHLTRPVEGDGETDPRRHAKALHRRWLADGIIAPDPEPSLYLYAIEGADGVRRLGLCCLVGVAPDRDDDLRPHEQTVAKPLADRLALLETLAVDLEPVMLLAEDPQGRLETLLQEDLESCPPLVRHHDRERSDLHSLHRLAADRLAAYRELLTPRFAAIADGHHRTKVAQLYARQTGAEGAAAAKLAVLTSLASPSLRIDPIHRAVLVEVATSPLSDLIRRRQSFDGSSGAELAAAVAAAEQPAIGAWIAGGAPEIWSLEPDPAGGEAADLPVSLLHERLLPAAGLGREIATDGSIAYRSDGEDLYRTLAAGNAKAGFWLPPMSAEAFAAATASGKLLPPKSTRFLPKLVSGLVWSSHDGAVL